MTTYSGKDFWKAHPTKWPTVPLRKVAKLGTGHTPSRSVPEYWENCTIPWLTTEDLTSRRGVGPLEPVMQTRQLISELGLAHSAAELHPADTVMLSRTASVGHVARVGKPMATTQAFVTWACSEALDPRYLTAALLAMNPEFFRLAYGSTHLTIYMPDIEQLRVPLPPLAEQRAIASHVDAETARIDALITKKQQLIYLLEERLDALVDEHFSPGPFDPTVRLARLASVQTGVTLNAGKVNTGNTVRLPYLRVANVQPGWLDLSEVKEVDVDPAAAARSLLQPGDVLMTEGGDIDKLGRGTVWRGEIENCLHQNHVFAVRPRPGQLDPDFLANLTRTSHARSYFESTGVQSTNLASTNSFKVADFRVPALDIHDQRARCVDYHRSAQPLSEVESMLRHQIGLLAEHRRGLITSAVTGDLVIPT